MWMPQKYGVAAPGHNEGGDAYLPFRKGCAGQTGPSGWSQMALASETSEKFVVTRYICASKRVTSLVDSKLKVRPDIEGVPASVEFYVTHVSDSDEIARLLAGLVKLEINDTIVCAFKLLIDPVAVDPLHEPADCS